MKKPVWSPDQQYRVPTADGAAIALGRYRPRGGPPRPFSVVLCHGLATNRFGLDFDERWSLARHLARRGFETWVLELRGRGVAGRPLDATFDEQAQHDVAAALATVRSTSNGGPVAWVGHSKGALVALAHLARNPAAPIRALVAMGAPLNLSPEPGLSEFVALAGPALKLPYVPLRAMTKPFAWWGLPPAPLGPYLANPDNIDAAMARMAIAHVTADVSGGVARQFARWVRTGAFDADDGFDYRLALKQVTVPTLLMAGAKDKLAPPHSVRAGVQQLGGPTQFKELSVREGFSADYGHGDLALGRNAPDEVYPLVADFLERLPG